MLKLFTAISLCHVFWMAYPQVVPFDKNIEPSEADLRMIKLSFEGVHERDRFIENHDEIQVWNPHSKPPESNQDAGLEEPVTLVWTDMYFDGGTRGYLFKDRNGHYLAVSNGPGAQLKEFPDRINAPISSRLFVGSLHYLDENSTILESGAKSERYIKNLIEKANRVAESVNSLGPHTTQHADPH